MGNITQIHLLTRCYQLSWVGEHYTCSVQVSARRGPTHPSARRWSSFHRKPSRAAVWNGRHVYLHVSAQTVFLRICAGGEGGSWRNEGGKGHVFDVDIVRYRMSCSCVYCFGVACVVRDILSKTFWLLESLLMSGKQLVCTSPLAHASACWKREAIIRVNHRSISSNTSCRCSRVFKKCLFSLFEYCAICMYKSVYDYGG